MINKSKRIIISLSALLFGLAVCCAVFASMLYSERRKANGAELSRAVYALTALADCAANIRDAAANGDSAGIAREAEKGIIYVNMLGSGENIRSIAAFFSSASAESYEKTEKISAELYGALAPLCKNGVWNAKELPTLAGYADMSEAKNYFTERLPITDIMAAKKLANEYLSTSIELKNAGLKNSGFESYVFTCGNGYIEITRRGGKPVRMAIDHEITDPKLGAEDCLVAAEKFIAKCGYIAEPLSYTIQDGMLCADYAIPGRGERAISVGINTENGRVSFFDASVYIENYTPE